MYYYWFYVLSVFVHLPYRQPNARQGSSWCLPNHSLTSKTRYEVRGMDRVGRVTYSKLWAGTQKSSYVCIGQVFVVQAGGGGGIPRVECITNSAYVDCLWFSKFVRGDYIPGYQFCRRTCALCVLWWYPIMIWYEVYVVVQCTPVSRIFGLGCMRGGLCFAFLCVLILELWFEVEKVCLCDFLWRWLIA